MKSILRFFVTAVALGLAFYPLLSRAAGPTPETREARLNKLVSLTSDQATKVTEIFRKEDAELAALSPADRGAKSMDIRQDSRERVRALLTLAQRKIYDRTKTGLGGGLTLQTPDVKLENLDKSVGLTAAQKTVVAQIYQEEFDSLLAIEPADRMEKGMPFRQAARDQVRAVLTPEQLDKMDNVRQASIAQYTAERTAVENQLRASKNLAARVGSILSLTPGGSSSTTESSDGSRGGTYTVRAVGSTGTEVLTVSWERVASTGEIKIVRVEVSGGAVIQL